MMMRNLALLAVLCVAPVLVGQAPAKEFQWTDVRELGLEGQGFADVAAPFDRLPARAESLVPKPVWQLSHCSTGLCVRFVSDATTLQARWALTQSRLDMPHMPATGVSGLDLYVMTREGWRWLATPRPTEQKNTARLVADLPAQERTYLLYFPLYNGVTSVEIGVPEGAKLAKAPEYPAGLKPLLFYGTSITQGGCASRPGMVHTAILGRRLGLPVINLGFSGNGKMEPALAHLLAELDPAVFVLDCLPNMNGAMVTERVEPFVKILRAKHPTTPILLVEDRLYADGFLVEARLRRNHENRRALGAAYRSLVAGGDHHVHLLSGDGLLGEDGEGTVDGSHPTDLGFLRHADAFEPVLRKLLPTAVGR